MPGGPFALSLPRPGLVRWGGTRQGSPGRLGPDKRRLLHQAMGVYTRGGGGASVSSVRLNATFARPACDELPETRKGRP